MSATPTPLDLDAALGARRAIVRSNAADAAEIEMVEARWGSDPHAGDGRTFRFVRSEGRTFPTHRCLVPASEFHMKVGDKRYRVTLDDGNFFYLAGIWEAATDASPLAFRIITVAANPDIARYQDRHGAIILRRQAMGWLDHSANDGDLLATPAARMFRVQQIHERQPAQAALAL